MELVFSTKAFEVAGVTVEGFPLFLTNDGLAVEQVLLFFVEHLLQRGSARSVRTWRSYAYAMKDFFSFCELHGRQWNEKRVIGLPSVIAAYRDWAFCQRQHHVSTINNRLDLLICFYRFAKKSGYIDTIPFGFEDRLVPIHHSAEFSRASPSWEAIQVPDVKLKSRRSLLRVLSYAQARAFLTALSSNPTHQLMAKLQLATGIRVEELVTFPASFVCDPRAHPDVIHWFTVMLDATKMSTKSGVTRTIHVPRKIMEDLWRFMAIERPSRIDRSKPAPVPLFLTMNGRPFRTRSVWKLYGDAEQKCGIHVNPHLLRHTYATHALAALSHSKNVGNALLYVRDRLGHASVKTTEIYLHHVHDAGLSISGQYQADLNTLFIDGQGLAHGD